jgi:hypothetical protein
MRLLGSGCILFRSSSSTNLHNSPQWATLKSNVHGGAGVPWATAPPGGSPAHLHLRAAARAGAGADVRDCAQHNQLVVSIQGPVAVRLTVCENTAAPPPWHPAIATTAAHAQHSLDECQHLDAAVRWNRQSSVGSGTACKSRQLTLVPVSGICGGAQEWLPELHRIPPVPPCASQRASVLDSLDNCHSATFMSHPLCKRTGMFPEHKEGLLLTFSPFLAGAAL